MYNSLAYFCLCTYADFSMICKPLAHRYIQALRLENLYLLCTQENYECIFYINLQPQNKTQLIIAVKC